VYISSSPKKLSWKSPELTAGSQTVTFTDEKKIKI
jgi:hypothetical protein